MEEAPKDWESPIWKDAGRVHEWKNYISEEIQGIWDTFTVSQKQAIARGADELSGLEEWD